VTHAMMSRICLEVWIGSLNYIYVTVVSDTQADVAHLHMNVVFDSSY
jgi:hypothetical protein